ncbi:unnamed protein product [Cylindrotheca closterium]|uniref:CRAL-TRIO domain-containing protein n=1 Tax=Cylindrotheca closterium TaxID=2856 RepID=A0AAD2PXT6_9STRA|nr:unnamed protein product [Cylindrotheca closterium]
MPKFRLGRSHTTHSKDGTDTSFTSASGGSDEMHLATKHAEAICLRDIKDCFRKFGIRLPDETVFRYASFYNFDAELAIDGIHEDNGNPYLKLKMEDLEEQFESNAVFPLPKLRTRKNDSEIIYMKPARFNANEGDSEKLIESLCYVLNDLSQTVEQCRNGVTVIADMQDVTKENFSKDHCAKLMQALQGTMVPTRVEAFIIVSPPSWFSKVFKWMKSKVSKDFLKRVHLTQQDQLPHFLMDDYEMYLPDDLCQGRAVASEICEDYMDLKVIEETKQR